MKVDSHFYAILAFCRAVGFDKNSAHTVAYASQFVDDAKINQIVLEKEPSLEIEFQDLSGEPSFLNMATCHSYFKLDTFNFDAMMNNTTAFHFVPGCDGNNFSKKLRCKKESPIIMDIINDVKQEDDLVKLGLVLHAFADTFSHQGFSGLLSKVNDIKDCEPKTDISGSGWEKLIRSMRIFFEEKFESLSDKAIPAYGHGQAVTYPDIPYLKWEYKYDYSDEFTKKYKTAEIDNKERFKSAFEKIKSHLIDFLQNNKKYIDKNVTFDNYELLYEALLQEGSLEERIENWQELLLEKNLFDEEDSEIIKYDENFWLEEAFASFDEDEFLQRKVVDVKLSDNFIESKWYKYYLASNWYKEKFYDYSEKYLLNIPK